MCEDNIISVGRVHFLREWQDFFLKYSYFFYSVKSINVV